MLSFHPTLMLFVSALFQTLFTGQKVNQRYQSHSDCRLILYASTVTLSNQSSILR